MRAKTARPPGRSAAVIMVVFHTGPTLFETIPKALDEPLVDEFVVIDNGSSVEDAARLREIAKQEPRLRLIQGQGNVGFARGCNLGAAAATADYLIVLNPDAYLEPDCAAALIAASVGFPSPCVVGARVLNIDGSEQRGARRGEVTPLTTLLSLSGLARAVPALRRYEIHWGDQPLPAGPVAVPTISGACFALSREDFATLGGLDEGYFLHVEDIDLCWRARRAGGSVVFAPSAEVRHVGSTSGAPSLVVEAHKGRGLVRYFRKRAENPGQVALAWLLGPVILLASILRALLRPILGPVRGRS